MAFSFVPMWTHVDAPMENTDSKSPFPRIIFSSRSAKMVEWTGSQVVEIQAGDGAKLSALGNKEAHFYTDNGKIPVSNLAAVQAL